MYTISKSILFITSALFSSTLICDNNTFVEVADKNPLEIFTPSLKSQQRKKIILPNGLQVYLISDPEAVQSSAAVSVEVGSWHDPIEYPGTAHYVEHALFLGTESFPEEDGFFRFVSNWNGTVNAYTKPDRTVYMFSCNHEGMKEGLSRFGEFFHAPLFKPDSLKRELNAVHQEHMKNIQNDDWMAWFVFKQEQNQKHPNAKFSTGNYDTLNIISQETIKEWYKKHYSSDQMNLIIYSNQSIETLTTYASSIFGKIQKNTSNTNLPYEELLSSNQKGHIVFIEPVKDLRKITLTWELPKEYATDLNEKPADLIGYTIANQSDNSLIQYLKNEGLAEEIGYDVDVIGRENHLLNFYINLTVKGTKQLDIVLTHFYQALNQLKKRGLPPHIYNEFKRQTKLTYEWQSREDAFTYAMNFGDSMVDEPLETFPYKTSTIASNNPKRVRQLLLHLTPYNALTVVQAPSTLTKQGPDKTEKWMQVKYSVIPISEQQLSIWDHAEAHPKINIPFPNAFIADSLSLHTSELSSTLTTPKLFSEDESGKCYVWNDSFYGNPELGISISLKSPAFNEGSKSIAYTELYLNFLTQRLAPLTSMGKRGGIHTHFARNDLSLQIEVEGFNEKLSPYYLALIDKLKTSIPTKEEYEIGKERLSSIYENRSKNLPVVQGIFLMQSVLTNTSPTSDDLYKILQNSTYEDYLSFINSIYKESYIECLIGGNYDPKINNVLWSASKNSLVETPYSAHDLLTKKVLILPDQIASPYTMAINTPLQGNSAILTLQTWQPSLDKLASHQILYKVLSKSFFDTLRTKQQTGYITRCASVEDTKALMYLFYVQSTSHYPSELLARFDLFMEEFSNNMEQKITKEDFDMLKNTLVTTLTINPENIHTYLSESYKLAFTYNGNFNRNQELVKAIEDKSYEEFIQEAKLTLSRENRKRISVLVNGAPVANTNFKYITTTAENLNKLLN